MITFVMHTHSQMTSKPDAYILMFSVKEKASYNSLDKYYNVVKQLIGDENIPIVLCGNKVDCTDENRQVFANDIIIHRTYDIPYFDISSKSNYNFEKPLQCIATMLMGREPLYFAAS
jgi:GTP-binding nuclear protein Ran